VTMAIAARISQLSEIAPLREEYRRKMDCQIIHDSIHERPGWTHEYALELDGLLVAYGSVAVAGPWSESPALYEFFVGADHRARTFDLFGNLLSVCGAKIIETQSNDPILSTMLHTFTTNVRAEAILFEDGCSTTLSPTGARFRAATPEDTEVLRQQKLDAGAGWVVTLDSAVAGAGDVLYHYNRPYGDIYMAIAEPFRRIGLGAYLVQELSVANKVLYRLRAATSATYPAAKPCRWQALSPAAT
jgi:hypothetical protein